MGLGGRTVGLRRREPLRFSLTVLGRPVEVVTDAPPERARLDELLPPLRALDNAVVDRAVEAVEAAGERVSCARGCANCCKRQPVPVTPPEALALARLVDRLPEPRRSAVRAAFAGAVDQLRDAGLYDAFLDRDPTLSHDAALAIVRRYMGLGLHCPFLFEDACSIHPERPFVCRQYLVTTPPELCLDPLDNPVRTVPVPIAMASAVLDATEAAIGTPQYTVPLVLALEYAGARRAELSRKHDAPTILRGVLSRLNG